MNDLDRLIDQAARQMAQQEPSDALSGAVMARVAAGARPSSQRWLVWGSVAAAVAVGAFVMVAGANRTASTPEAQGSGLTAQAPERAHDSRPATTADAPTGQEPEALSQEPVGRPAPALASASGLVADLATAEIDDPIAFESITPAAIEVDRLDVTVTSIDPVEIAPLQIAPISASDD
jgi:hypothetical protein